MDPEVVGTTGMSSGAAPSTRAIVCMCNCGANARTIMVLQNTNILNGWRIYSCISKAV